MEAAITAASRGHAVTLYEKTGELGGQLLSERYIPFKQDMYNSIVY
jgi:NADPH-dependent 2,4-dienoyl-CoA reductase/sulfur reductase-like enzyme